jgi:hypothetical protein
MGKIVVSENVTLDGVVQDPAGAEGFGHGGWVGRVGEGGREEAAKYVVSSTLQDPWASRSTCPPIRRSGTATVRRGTRRFADRTAGPRRSTPPRAGPSTGTTRRCLRATSCRRSRS